MSVPNNMRTILSAVVVAVALTACAADRADSPGAQPPTTTPDPTTPSPSVGATPSPTATQETPSDDGPLSVGDEGPRVGEVQTMLKALGYEVTIDGTFGTDTKEAVVSFEMQTGLPGDGSVGAEERRALKAAVEAQKQEDDENEKPDDNESNDSSDSLLQSGDEGREVRNLQRELERLGYWVGPKDGVYGPLTEQSVLALQGVEGLNRDGIFGPKTRSALRKASRPKPREASGDHIEIDEARAVILVVRDGRTRWTFHTSTGTEESYQHPSGDTYLADTPNGRWTFSWQVDGWRDGRLGRMWRPKYFHEDGIAIHGYPTVPAYPASHGCARVTMSAMDFIWENDLAPQGSTVIVYGRG